MTEQRDYRDTVFLPKTDFPMKAGLPAKEPGILARWQAIDLYRELRNRRKGREKFILHDGPPYANGDMHIGHALNHILKDMVVRTQNLRGKDAPYIPGWDCHGLPIEWKVEEEYRKKKRNKDDVPVEEFRAECRAYAQHWVNVQREQLKRLGINGDWDNPYLTMDFAAEATIVTELMKFAESGQLYRGAKPVMWSPVEKTALAEAEVEYEDITSTQIDVAFEIIEAPNCPAIQELLDKGEKVSAVIWTTTPWTIPVNQAIAYGRMLNYALLTNLVARDRSSDASHKILIPGIYLVSTSLLKNFADRLSQDVQKTTGNENYRVDISNVNAPMDFDGNNQLAIIHGSDLAGAMARHPMAGRVSSPLPFRGGAGGGACQPEAAPVDSPHPNPSPEREGLSLAEFFDRPRPFLDGSAFVTTDTGTGLVHMSPDHGEDDFDLCKANGIEPVFAVGSDGRYRDDWPWVGGEALSVINNKLNAPPNADGTGGRICEDLNAASALLSARNDESTRHSYPHSWRSKAKVIYRCTPQWFVPMDKPLKPSPLEGRGLGEGAVTGVALSDFPLSPALSPEGEREKTLRQTALAAIADTRWVPEKGRNRMRSMVEGRPDWVLSRQRAWGVPITLFVNRKSGQYLYDPAVNARIIAAIAEYGVDAWNDARAQDYLGSEYDAADYERVIDILDVWFDSGCTHAFVLESGRWPDLVRAKDYQGSPADLYLEGSDQHRGWFQSSLLESCGTRGRAPYKAVLTHGFTMDQKGMKMSKSLGNTTSPTDLMRDSGADILRLWALSVDFTEDHRIGKEILSGVSDQYRKLRNSFRYLLGALDGFSDAEKMPVEDMPELERYVLHLLADMDGKLKQAVDDFDFNTYVRLITDFANNDLSAFFFDIRKDSLYCDAATSPKRRAYRTVLDILFHALVRYAAPVLVFTAEEVWQTRFPDAEDSVHFLEWPDLPFARHSREGGNPYTQGSEVMDPRLRGDDGFVLMAKWRDIRTARSLVTEAIEPYRRDKTIGSSLQAEAMLTIRDEAARNHCSSVDMAEISITASCLIVIGDDDLVLVQPSTNHKCGRCWRHLPEVIDDGSLCNRCADVVND